jgi:predicted sulfurtransferase
VMMQRAGLKNTYQLDGWVVKYINSFNDGNWEGNLYVFDDRVSAEVGDEKTHITVWECIHSGKKTDNCENCRYSPCNARLIVDKEEHEKHLGFCSKECYEKWLSDLLIKDVDFDSKNYRKIRLEMRDNPGKKQGIIDELSARLAKKLWNTEFTNIKSQKEDFVMD